MQRTLFLSSQAPAIFLLGLLVSTPVLADKPDWAGGGQGGKHDQNDQGAGSKGSSRHEQNRDEHGNDDDRRGSQNDRDQDAYRDDDRRHTGAYIDESRRSDVRGYYAEQIRAGRCPPGLAKKHNGCLPPGQAKKWKVGHRLPRDLVFYDPPPEVLVYLGLPPPAHRFVRVANDILLIAVGTGLVMDAIQDLGAI